MNSIPSRRDASNGPDVKTKFLSFIHTKEKSGRAVSPVLAVTVGARNWPGMLHVSAKNPLALEFDKARAAPLMGFNVFGDFHLRGKPLKPDRIDRDRMRIERLATAGGNFIRLRADSWWYALDNPPDEAAGYSGMGRINLRSAWDIDQLVSLCEAKDIQVMFCFENANAHVNEPNIPWRKEFNTYEKSRGGTVEAMADFWTDPVSKKTFLRKLRYAVARWGASPSLAMWEFFNEVEILSAPVAAWHGEMATYLKSNDPHQRMVTTSGTARKQSEHDDALWKHAAIDVVQYHSYRYENTADLFSFCRNYIAQYGKPFIAGEFATKYVQENAIVRFDYRQDRNAMMPHLGHWGSAMFTFEKYASVARGEVTAGALVHSGGAHLWLANRTWSPETIMGILEAKPANGVTVTLEGLRNANATVEWIDPMSGKTLRVETVSITGGKTILNAGNVPHDIACRLKYL